MAARPRQVALSLALVLVLPAAAAAQPPLLGEEVCVTAAVEGAIGEVCAQRSGFGAVWAVELTDTADDGRPVKATVSLEVAEASDPSALVGGGDGAGDTVRASGDLRPRVGAALGDLTIETCVVIRFLPDRCRSASAPLLQLSSSATPTQLDRLEELVFEVPLEGFVEVRHAAERSGVEATFDWSSDGCSAGPFRELFDERLDAACLRHDFAYRNYGQLALDPTDEVRRRVDEQLAADAAAVGQGALAGGLRDTLRRFGAPVFYGDDLARLWGVPDFLIERLLPDDEDEQLLGSPSVAASDGAGPGSRT